MRRPSIFSSNYYKVMRRRRIITILMVFVLIITFSYIFYNKTAVNYIEKFALYLKKPFVSNNKQIEDTVPINNELDIKENKTETQENISNTIDIKKNNTNIGEYKFKLTDSSIVTLVYEKINNENLFTSLKAENVKVSYDISFDKKQVVFDDPLSSDIWLYKNDGTSIKLNADFYKQRGGEQETFNKSEVLSNYENYIWAAKPKILKDGRVVYQSNLPWFYNKNNMIYLWVIDNNGQNNRLCMQTNSIELIKYYDDDNNFIIELDGNKYEVDIDNGTKKKIN